MSNFFIFTTMKLESLISCVQKGCYGVPVKLFQTLSQQFKNISEGDRVFIRLTDELVCGPLIVSTLPSRIQFLETSGLWGKVNDRSTPSDYLPIWIDRYPWCFFFDQTLTMHVNYCKLRTLQSHNFSLTGMGIISSDIGNKLWEFIDASGSSFADFIQRIEPSARLYQTSQNTQRILSGHIKTKRGVFVRSKSERLIDDWLYDHNIRAEYERCTTIDGRVITPDFYLPDYDLIIEHLGLIDSSEDYRRNWTWKKELYEKNNIKYETTNESDISNLDRALSIKLKKYQK